MVLVTLHLQAFVELGSTDQAADIVTYYLSNPVMVKGGQVTFSVSSTFNFLQVHFYKIHSFIPFLLNLVEGVIEDFP